VAGGCAMLKDDIATYLAVRRAGGFKLEDDELYLYSFARFADAKGDTHVVAQTAITWAEQACSEAQRSQRLKAVIRFAHFSRATDSHHEIPPQGVFCSRRRRPTPYLFNDEAVQALMILKKSVELEVIIGGVRITGAKPWYYPLKSFTQRVTQN